jgi:steroid delta-isomerase-like uncharacterized protein
MSVASDIVKRLTDEAFVGGNTSVVDELVADDFVDHDPAPGFPATKDGIRMMVETIQSAFPDIAPEFDEYTDTTDGRVVENWAMIGTHTGEAFGLPPSGQKVRVRGVEIFRLDGGKIVEHWGAVDMSDFFAKATGQG